MSLIEQQTYQGRVLRQYLAGLECSVLLRGQCCLGYYAGFTTCIENHGLTDKHIARQPMQRRARIGHEKRATLEYMSARRVNFVFDRTPYREEPLLYFFGSNGQLCRAEVITHDPVLEQILKQRLGPRLIIRR